MSGPESAALAPAAALWDSHILPALVDYIRIPALSPAFDGNWVQSGELARAVALMRAWAEARAIPGATVEVVELPGLTPVLLVEIPGSEGQAGPDADTVLLYGHYDKQPPMSGWADGYGPWTPIETDGRLYGRGSADDGYALFASMAAIEIVRSTGGRHARCVVLIEGSEESGSPHLPAYIEALGARIGTPSLMMCLDSGCADYERLWVTSSLRGLIAGTLAVEVTSEGSHSGAVGGVVPSTFRILRQLLDRVENSATGAVSLAAANVAIPQDRVGQTADLLAAVGDRVAGYPLLAGVDVRVKAPVELELDRTWRPSLEIIGADDLPPTSQAGNVLRPRTAVKLSIRLPPTADPDAALAELANTLTTAPPYGARVTFTADTPAPGWNAPPLTPWLADALAAGSRQHFGQPMGYVGEGGTIPLMGLLQRSFPEAQFAVVGVLGPGSNAHGPNEFLHIATGKRLTACMADVLAAHASRS